MRRAASDLFVGERVGLTVAAMLAYDLPWGACMGVVKSDLKLVVVYGWCHLVHFNVEGNSRWGYFSPNELLSMEGVQ